MQGNKNNQQITGSNSIFDLSIFTTIGDREEQQDSFGCELMPNEGLVVICDGMGGHRGGKIASSLAVGEFLEAYTGGYSSGDAVEFLAKVTKSASQKIQECKSDDRRPLNGGSTVVAVLIRDNRMFWSSVGDSRAYLFRNGEYVQITVDHNYNTVLTEKLDAGMIDETEFASESDRAEALISYLGISNLQLIDYNNEDFILEKGDKIVIMTDGLYKIVSEAEIFKVVDNFSNIAEALQALESKAKKNARNTKNRDNMTVAIISVK